LAADLLQVQARPQAPLCHGVARGLVAEQLPQLI